MLMQLNFKVSKDLVEMMDECVDDVQFRSRGQILNIALAEWLARRVFPEAHSAQGFIDTPDRQRLKRRQLSRDLQRVIRDDPMSAEEKESLLEFLRREFKVVSKDLEADDLSFEVLPFYVEPASPQNEFTGTAWTMREQLKSEIIEELRVELGISKAGVGGSQDGGTEPEKKRKRKTTKPKTSG